MDCGFCYYYKRTGQINESVWQYSVEKLPQDTRAIDEILQTINDGKDFTYVHFCKKKSTFFYAYKDDCPFYKDEDD